MSVYCQHQRLKRDCPFCPVIESARKLALEEAAAICDAYSSKHDCDIKSPYIAGKVDAANYCADEIRAAVEKGTT
jgi:hypothetical protein